MNIQFNKSSHTATYIQNILQQKYIPSCISLTPYLSKELKQINSKPLAELVEKLPYIDKQYFYKGGESKPTQPWEFGARVPNLTFNLVSNQNYYSSEVHEWLGRYLRAYRDYYGVDVMGLYNCFSNRLISRITLPVTTTSGNYVKWWQNGASTDSKTTCFPIQVGSRYKIKISNSLAGPILIQPLFFNGFDLIKCDSSNGARLYLQECTAQIGSEFIYEASLKNLCSLQKKDEDQFKKDCRQLLQSHNCLYLFLQVPTQEDLKVSVIEEAGYINASHKTLLENADCVGKPFSDKLLGYLTGHTITPATDILPNIELVQRIISSKEFESLYGGRLTNYSAGIFDEVMHKFIYQRLLNPEGTNDTINKYMSNGYIPDFTGCVDKDVEQLLWIPLSAEMKGNLLKIIGV